MNIIEMLPNNPQIALLQLTSMASFRSSTKHKRLINYKDLIKAGLEYGGLLQKNNIKKGDYVLIFSPLSIDFYIVMIGAWSIGAVPIFIDFSRGSDFVNQTANRLNPAVVICDSLTAIIRLKYKNLRKIKMFKVDKSHKNPTEIQKLSPDHPAIITFTSGTGGNPKNLVRSHGFLINQYNVLKKHIDFNEHHTDFATLPVFTLANLAGGMFTILPNHSYKGLKLPTSKYLNNITRIICSPYTFQQMQKKSKLSSLQKLYLGGGPVYPSVFDEIPQNIDAYIVYGSTEAEPISKIAWNHINEDDREKIATGAGLLVGVPVSEIKLKISQENEILVAGEHVISNQDWHKTGDTGYLDHRGRLWLTGRLSQVIRDDLGTLYPFCVECVLDAELGIRGAVVLYKGKRTVVIDELFSVPDKIILSFLEPFFIKNIIKIEKLPMDKRHNVKIDYTQLMKDIVDF